MKRHLFYGSVLTGLCIVLAALTLALSGCSSVAHALNIQNPRYSFRDIRPHIAFALPLNQSTLDLDFSLAVDNPNSVGLRMDRVDFDLLVDDNPVLQSVSRDPRVEIPARGLGLVHLTTRVGYQQIQNLWGLIVERIQGNRANYSLRGTAFYDTPVGQLRFPVTVYSSNR